MASFVELFALLTCDCLGSCQRGDLQCYLTKIKLFLQYQISLTNSWISIQKKKGHELPTTLALFSKQEIWHLLCSLSSGWAQG